MKIRNGFVSNSSSSSFIVQFKDSGIEKEQWQLPEKTIEKLRKIGFRVTTDPNPLEYYYRNSEPRNSEEYNNSYNMGFGVTCNEQDIARTLIKNKISFKMMGHYCHYTIIYDAKTDQLIHAHNFGNELAMYGVDSIGFRIMKETPKYEKSTGKKYLEETV